MQLWRFVLLAVSALALFLRPPPPTLVPSAPSRRAAKPYCAQIPFRPISTEVVRAERAQGTAHEVYNHIRNRAEP
ncbi:hypothetical protein EVAR_101140_1 [Eumeta japonica]|uniref:Secreted protein n=1 Tax=Eumeta variegata TaxID=151549 RepID=A0A4C2AHU5_EUMVA|nr:hypothetical protein EVAR_101140_1 [Eumeta japonica]